MPQLLSQLRARLRVSHRGIERAGIAIHVIAIAGALFAFDPEGRSLERYHLVKEAWLAGCGVALAIFGLARRRAAPLDGIDLALLALVAIDLVASIATSDPDVASRSTLLTAVLAAIALDLRGRSLGERETIGTLALVLVTIAALISIAESYRLAPAISLRSYAPGATVGQRNNAGHIFALALAGCAAMAMRSERRRVVVGVMGTAVVLATAIVLTRSRAAWLAALLGVAVAMALAGARVGQRRTFALRGTIVVATIILGAAVPLALRPSLAWRQASPYADTARRLFEVHEGSGHGRLVQWETSLELAREHPVLGVGPGQWAIHYPRIAAQDDPTMHREAWAPTSRLSTNDLLAWLVERGVLGLAALVVLLASAARRLARADDPRLGPFCALVVASALDCVLSIATGVVAIAQLLPERTPRARRPRPAAPIAAVATLAFGLAGAPRALERAWVAHRGDRADLAQTARLAARDPWNVPVRTRLAEHALFAGDCRAASRWLDDLARLRPFHPRIARERDGCRGAPR